MMHPGPAIAFHAPMKAPDHPVPSGDRQIARLTLRALEQAGFTPRVASELRVLDMAGDADTQNALAQVADLEVQRLADTLCADPPAAWFTYHCHYKAPDLIGPAVSGLLGIPYVISEPSLSPRRREGPWAAFAAASEQAIAAADLLLWTTERDRPALEAAGHGARMRHLPAFVDAGALPRPRRAAPPWRFLTVAMMRPGDKVESYRRLAAGLAGLKVDWVLEVIGDGAARAEVEGFFRPFAGRVSFTGALDDPAAIRARMESADLFLWPGVNEGVGMVWLEAQAAGLPVIAEDHPAARALVSAPLAPPDDAAAYAARIADMLSDLPAHALAARAHVDVHHGLDAAARRLRDVLAEVLP